MMKKKIARAILRGLDKPLDKTIKAARKATGRTAKGKGKTLREKRESLDRQLVKQGKTNRAIKKTVYGGAGTAATERSTRRKKTTKSSYGNLRKRK